MAEQRIKGIVPVLLTPLDKDLAPDEKGTKSLVNFLISKGIGGFWAMGSASEDINLSFENKIRSLEYVAEANDNRVPLLAGTGLAAIDDILRYISELEDRQVKLDGVHLLPYDIKMGESRLFHYFTYIADRSSFPIWLYHNPKRGRAITDKVINELKYHPNIRGIKIGGYNLSELTNTMMHNSPDFQVIGAGSGQLYTMLALGAEAHTTSDASCFPEPFVEIYKLFNEGDLLRAREKQFELIKLSRNIPRSDNGEYAAEEKFILKHRGICGDEVNPLYAKTSEHDKKRILEVFSSKGFDWAQ